MTKASAAGDQRGKLWRKPADDSSSPTTVTSPDATVTIASTDRLGSSACGSPSYPTVAICDPSGDQAGLSQKRLDNLAGDSFSSGCGFVPCGSVTKICCAPVPSLCT